MDKIVDYLKQLDLSDAEAKLYLTLLKTGPTSVRDLAATVDIKRTTAYFYIDQLVEKGLIMKLVHGSKKLVAANEPENLKILVEAKLKKADEVKKGFPDVLKLLTTSLPKENGSNDAEIKYYKGKNGVKKIYEDVLNANEIRSYVNIEEVIHVFPENEGLFEKAINNNKKMIMFEFIEDSKLAREIIGPLEKGGRYQSKFLPKDTRIEATDIIIYDGKISFINLKDRMSGIILQNTELYNNLKVLYDLLWRLLPE